MPRRCKMMTIIEDDMISDTTSKNIRAGQCEADDYMVMIEHIGEVYKDYRITKLQVHNNHDFTTTVKILFEFN